MAVASETGYGFFCGRSFWCFMVLRIDSGVYGIRL